MLQLPDERPYRNRITKNLCVVATKTGHFTIRFLNRQIYRIFSPSRASRLPVTTQKALQQLACIGNSAEIVTLSIVHETPEDKVHADLWASLRLGLVIRSDGSYKFVHDRVQEAAYSLIPARLRAEAHLRIGRLLTAHTPPEKREEAIFEMVNQVNRGAALIISRKERRSEE